jgi:hypothetical protein
MAGLDDLFSTLVFMGAEKLHLASTTRTLLMPHIPKVTKFLNESIQNDKLTLFLKNNVFVIIFTVIVIGLVYKCQKHIGKLIDNLISKFTKQKSKVDENIDGYSKNMIVVQKSSTIIGIIKFILNNESTEEYFKCKHVGDIHVTTYVNSDTKNRDAYEMHDVCSMNYLSDNFVRDTVDLPSDVVIDFKLPEDKFPISNVEITINTRLEPAKPIQPEPPKEENDANQPNQPSKYSNVNHSTMLNRLKMEMTFKFKKSSNVNALAIYSYFIRTIDTDIKNRHQESIKNQKKLIIKKYTSANGRSFILIYEGDAISIEQTMEMYLGNYVHQRSSELMKMVKIFREDCKKTTVDCFTNIIPHLSLLVHGPPGSGKSTLADKMAMALQRNIIILNMKDYFEFSDLVQFMKAYRSEKYIVLIDEIDKFIITLLKDMEKDTEIVDDENKRRSRVYSYDVDDLLPLFDDSYMAAGAITIATTNNPHVINNIGKGGTRGAMVRAGRLKSFKMDYFTREIVESLLIRKYGKNHTVKLNDKWFDKEGHCVVQNSNMISILKTTDEKDLVKTINDDIESYKKLQEHIEPISISTQVKDTDIDTDMKTYIKTDIKTDIKTENESPETSDEEN